ncbi:MAG: hypothetical protein ACJA1L_000346 [Paracoccaceae bacterium]|jgi:hypothetical protein
MPWPEYDALGAVLRRPAARIVDRITGGILVAAWVLVFAGMLKPAIVAGLLSALAWHVAASLHGDTSDELGVGPLTRAGVITAALGLTHLALGAAGAS